MSGFRKYLGSNIGNEATLWSNNYEIKYRKDGAMLLLLQDYEVKKISHNRLSRPKPKSSGHLWIMVPEHLERKTKEIADASRKISLKGRIYSYTYKYKEGRNASLNLEQVWQVKPKKTKRA